MGGAGADIFNLEPEPKKKISRAGAEEKWLGSALLLSVPVLYRDDPLPVFFFFYLTAMVRIFTAGGQLFQNFLGNEGPKHSGACRCFF